MKKITNSNRRLEMIQSQNVAQNMNTISGGAQYQGQRQYNSPTNQVLMSHIIMQGMDGSKGPPDGSQFQS